MEEWIKDALIALGGGATVTIALLTIFKSLLVKICDKAIDTSFEKSTIKLTNRLERSTKAYEILLKKEFEYYEKLDPFCATLVPLVQDFEFYINHAQKDDDEAQKSNAKNKYRELLLEYLKMIPEIKNDSVLYQPYIPTEINNAVTNLISTMQEDIGYLKDVAEILWEKREGSIDITIIQGVSDKVLFSISLIELKVKNRLDELIKTN